MGDSFESNEEFFYWLRNIVPTSICVTGNSCLQRVEKIRLGILVKQRVSIILPLAANDVNLRDFTSPIMLNTQNVSASFIHQAAFLVSYFYSNLDKVAQAVFQSSNCSEFSYIAGKALPSLFGYFSSSEHNQLAMVFYLHVMNTFQPYLCYILLKPFFCSLCTHKYIESTMSMFFRKFGAEKRLLKNQITQSLINHFSKYLSNCICSNVVLLSTEILTIIHLMKSQKWSTKEISIMFFTNFLLPQAENWIISSQFCHMKQSFMMVVDVVMKNDCLMESIITVLTSTNSIYDFPKLYKGFNQLFVHILVSTNDIFFIWKYLVSTFTSIPYSIRGFDFSMIMKEDRDQLLHLKVYPKYPSPVHQSKKYLIFSGIPQSVEYSIPIQFQYLYVESKMKGQSLYELSKKRHLSDNIIEQFLKKEINDLCESALSFENLIDYLTNEKSLMDFVCLSESLERNVLNRFLFANEQKSCRYDCIKGNIDCVEILQYSYISQLMNKYETIITNNNMYFSEMRKLWENHLLTKKNMINPLFLQGLNKTGLRLFWNIVEELSMSESIVFQKRFFLLFSILNKVKFLQKEKKDFDTIMEMVVTFSQDKTLLTAFIIYGTFLMRDMNFLSIINEEQLKLWTNFEGFMLKYISLPGKPHLQTFAVFLQSLLVSCVY